MEKQFRVGDKVIGFRRGCRNMHIGKVLNLNMQSFGQGNDILIDTNPESKIDSMTLEEFTKQQAIMASLEILVKEFTVLYTEKLEKKLLKLLKHINSRVGRDFLPRVSTIHSFIEKKRSVILLRITTYLRFGIMKISSVFEMIIFGTLELILGDIYRFYKIRYELKLSQYALKREKALYNSLFTGHVTSAKPIIWPKGFSYSDNEEEKMRKDEIAKLENRITTLQHEKSLISRSFLALMVASFSLLVSMGIIKLKTP